MRRLFALILVISLWFGSGLTTNAAAWADFDALTPCSQSSAFKQNLDSRISGYKDRLALYKAGSEPAKYLEGEIEAAKARFAKYADANLLCGDEGYPHLITDGRLSRAGEFIIPSLIFLYITGWIGWVGRGYLRAIGKDPDTATEKEIVLDVQLAIQFMLTGFVWPLAALREFGTGDLLASEKEITVSPR